MLLGYREEDGFPGADPVEARNQGCGSWLQSGPAWQGGAKGAASLRHEHKMLSTAMQKRGTRVWEYAVKMAGTHRGHMCRHIRFAM